MPDRFDIGAFDGEAKACRLAVQRAPQIVTRRFGYRVTGFANKEHGRMGRAGMGAGDEGVQPAYTMRKPLIHKEFQGAIGNRRLLAEPRFRQPVEHLVGAKGPVLCEQDFQGATAHGRQANALLGTDFIGAGESLVGAGFMVMRVKSLGGVM